jgi:hypothetical protein
MKTPCPRLVSPARSPPGRHPGLGDRAVPLPVLGGVRLRSRLDERPVQYTRPLPLHPVDLEFGFFPSVDVFDSSLGNIGHTVDR